MSEIPIAADRAAQAHDVLAAEVFAMPAADPSIVPRPVVLPEDPTGISEAHDVLAAEEFAMPVGHPPRPVPASRGRGRTAVLLLGALGLLLALARRRLALARGGQA